LWFFIIFSGISGSTSTRHCEEFSGIFAENLWQSTVLKGWLVSNHISTNFDDEPDLFIPLKLF